MSSNRVKPIVLPQTPLTVTEKRALRAATSHIGAVFEPGHNSIDVVQRDLTNIQSLGSTFMGHSPTSGMVAQVKFDRSQLADDNKDVETGKIAETLNHEIALHAIPNLQASGRAEHSETEEQQHHHMFTAPEHGDSGGERQRYIQQTRRTFTALDNPTQQHAFVDAWHESMGTHIEKYARGDQQRVEAIDWTRDRANSMRSAITRPEAHSWTQEDFHHIDTATDFDHESLHETPIQDNMHRHILERQKSSGRSIFDGERRSSSKSLVSPPFGSLSNIKRR